MTDEILFVENPINTVFLFWSLLTSNKAKVIIITEYLLNKEILIYHCLSEFANLHEDFVGRRKSWLLIRSPFPPFFLIFSHSRCTLVSTAFVVYVVSLYFIFFPTLYVCVYLCVCVWVFVPFLSFFFPLILASRCLVTDWHTKLQLHPFSPLIESRRGCSTHARTHAHTHTHTLARSCTHLRTHTHLEKETHVHVPNDKRKRREEEADGKCIPPSFNNICSTKDCLIVEHLQKDRRTRLKCLEWRNELILFYAWKVLWNNKDKSLSL